MKSPSDIAKGYIETGRIKADTPLPKLFTLAVFAGMYIAFAGAGASAGSTAVSDPALSRIVNALIFPAGLIMVVLAGSELFTGDNLMIISAVKGRITIWELLRTWIVVYTGNLAGSVLIALIFVLGHVPDLYGGALAQALVNTASAKVSMSFSDAFLRGILCNILVCAAVWITAGGSSAAEKISGLYFPIMIFVLAGYEHSVANMFYIPAGMLTAEVYGISAEGLDLYGFFIRNLLPVTLGNITGGAAAVGMGYYFIYLHGRE